MHSRLLGLLLMCVTAVLALGGCRTRCSSDADCVKACQCHGQEWCSVGLLCENTLCEEEEGVLCGAPGDTFCEKWGNNCGTRRCKSEQDCRKTCQCTGTSPTAPNAQCCFQKDLIFSCGEDDLCDNSFGQACDTFCQDLEFQFSPVCVATDRVTGTQWDRTTCPSTTTAPGQNTAQ